MKLISFLAAGSTALVVGSAVSAAPIDLNPSAGDPSGVDVPAFSWMGFDFVLSPQPGGVMSADHFVTGDSDGEVSIVLEEPGRVSYQAVDFSLGDNERLRVGTRYGSDLDEATSGYSFLQPFLRTLDENGPSTAVSLLTGSSAGNPASPFTGVQFRDEESGSFDDDAFLDNVVYGSESLFDVMVTGDGTVSGSVANGGRVASLTEDLSTGDSGFALEDFLLQVGSFQDPEDFRDQFPNGQTFTFTQANVAPVPVPATLPLLLGAVGGAAAVARRKTRG